MLIWMRTTINLPDPLYRELKRFAAEHGKTVTDVIQDAVSETLLRQSQRSMGERLVLPTFKGNGMLPGVDLSDNAGLRDLMDGL
ncbi:DUF2191 domain-containing protein [bacterium]|nr:DUF2191 domain-containing protein [bacterium]